MEIKGITNVFTEILICDLLAQSQQKVPIPCGPGCYRREYQDFDGPVDIMLHRDVCLNIGLRIEVAIRTDGTVWFAGTEPAGNENCHWHFSREWSNYDPEILQETDYRGENARKIAALRPTTAQFATLARWFLGIDKPFGLHGGLGRPVCTWAFRGYTPSQLSDAFGDGSPVYLV